MKAKTWELQKNQTFHLLFHRRTRTFRKHCYILLIIFQIPGTSIFLSNGMHIHNMLHIFLNLHSFSSTSKPKIAKNTSRNSLFFPKFHFSSKSKLRHKMSNWRQETLNFSKKFFKFFPSSKSATKNVLLRVDIHSFDLLTN